MFSVSVWIDCFHDLVKELLNLELYERVQVRDDGELIIIYFL